MPHRRHAAEAGAELRIVAIGERARRSLERSDGMAHPLGAFPDSPWYQAGREIVWIGARLPALHPRAVMTASPPVRGRELHFEAVPRSAWSPRLPRPDRTQVANLISGARRLRKQAARLGTAGGFGALVVGETPQFPLDRATPLVRALGKAFAAGDPDAVVVAARPLLGLGAGLTPSGDDLVGGAIFGKRLASGADPLWTGVGRKLSREIRSRSHMVSAALFSDLAAGRSFAPLHELAAALAAADDEAARRAARSLVAIGHSSGWDMLAGFLMGAGGPAVSSHSRQARQLLHRAR